MVLATETFADLITFARASTGTRFNSSGVLATEAVDAARFDYDPGDSNAALGLLLEGQRTNLLRYSQDLSNAAWNKVNSSAALDQTDLTGTSNAASRLTSANTGATGAFRAQQAVTVSGTNAVYWAVVKAGTVDKIQIEVTGMTNVGVGKFDLTAGSVLSGSHSSAQMRSLGSGRWLLWIVLAVGADATGNFLVQALNSSGGTSFTPLDGTQTFDVLASGVESGNFPTSPIKTTASQVTRSADNASMTGADFSDWFNASEGSFVLEVELLPGARDGRVLLDLSDGTADNRITVAENASSQIVVTVRSGGVDQASLVAHTITDYTVPLEIAFAFKANDFAASVNGGSVATDTGGTVPTVDRLNLGRDYAGANMAMAWIRKLDFYPERLSNAELQDPPA